MFKREAEGDSSMTISAQVIDTIVEWIDDNLHQPLRIEEIARHAGYSKWHLQRLFMQYKGESLGRYIRERKLLLAARDLRESDARVYDICLRYGFDSQQTFTRIFTRTFNQPPGRTARRTTVSALSCFPPWRVEIAITGRVRRSRHPAFLLAYDASENQRRQTKRSTKNSMAPSSKNHTQNRMV
jgi:AraC family multidrug resistance transcriptional activator